LFLDAKENIKVCLHGSCHYSCTCKNLHIRWYLLGQERCWQTVVGNRCILVAFGTADMAQRQTLVYLANRDQGSSREG
jgi:hypothetical protein